MDCPDLPQTLRSALLTVLARHGMSPGEIERLSLALAASKTPDAVLALLEARHPEHAAWVAPISGHLHQQTSGYLLTEEAELTTDYKPSFGVESVGGGVVCWSGDGALRRAYRFHPLDGRAWLKAGGRVVEEGEPLTNGELDPHVLLAICGEPWTLAILRDRAASLCNLDPAVAETIVKPLFELVEIVESGAGRLGRGTRVTYKRFEIEIGWAIGRVLAGLPASADPRLLALARLSDAERAEAASAEGVYEAFSALGGWLKLPIARSVLAGYPELATLDEEGRVPGSGNTLGTFDLGTFEITNGRLRVTDPCVFCDNAGKNDLPAVPGTWRAESIVEEVDQWGPQVTELRAWSAHLASVDGLDEVMEDAGFSVEVDSGMAGLFDVVPSAETEAARESFSEACCELALAAGPARATLVKDFGVVAFSGGGDGGYRCKVLQDEDGSVVAVSLDFRG